jgi:hypothetical protein
VGRWGVAQTASGVLVDVTLTCTSMPRWSDGNPMKVPWSGIAWCGSRTTADKADVAGAGVQGRMLEANGALEAQFS